jgi:hypothetical protein
MTWAMTLNISNDETLEKRLSSILNYIIAAHYPTELSISDLDATGKFGNQLTQKVNSNEEISISDEELLTLLNEDGQILEMNLNISSAAASFRIIIRDGTDLDMLGDVHLPAGIIGQYTQIDLSNFDF